MSNRLDIIKSRKGFYRQGYDRACGLLLASVGIILALSLILILVCFNRPLRDFYASAMNGNLVRLVPLDAPNHGPKPLID